jgi:hypothetical protein
MRRVVKGHRAGAEAVYGSRFLTCRWPQGMQLANFVGNGVADDFQFVDAVDLLFAQELRFADENNATIDSTAHTSASGGLKFANLAQR